MSLLNAHKFINFSNHGCFVGHLVQGQGHIPGPDHTDQGQGHHQCQAGNGFLECKVW